MASTSSKIVKLAKQVSTQATQQPRQLILRDFIHDRLYEQGGYFTQEGHQVGRLREPIKFSKLRGYYDFRQEMERLYPENAWVTPVELFKPYYGYTVSNFILNQMENMKQKKLRVVEMGPGTGTFADSLLDFYKNYNLDIYREAEYIFVEISPQLAEKCEQLMLQNHRKLMDEGKIKIFNGSFLEFKKKISQHCFVVGLEVLDNMPHDRLYYDEKGELKTQTMVDISYDENGKEILTERQTEITDQWCDLFAYLTKQMPEMDHVSASKVLKQQGLFKRIADMISFAKHKDTMTNNIFAPTRALELMQHVKQYIPDHTLILADFDSFIMPGNSIRGVNAPLVTHKLKDPTKWQTYDTYLIERGAADICFPVDFHFLKYAYEQMTGYNASVYKTREFVEMFGLESWCTTQNLYNPMKEEYFNTSLLVTEHKKV